LLLLVDLLFGLIGLVPGCLLGFVDAAAVATAAVAAVATAAVATAAVVAAAVAATMPRLLTQPVSRGVVM
jgi:hypothetical protein